MIYFKSIATIMLNVAVPNIILTFIAVWEFARYNTLLPARSNVEGTKLELPKGVPCLSSSSNEEEAEEEEGEGEEGEGEDEVALLKVFTNTMIPFRREQPLAIEKIILIMAVVPSHCHSRFSIINS